MAKKKQDLLERLHSAGFDTHQADPFMVQWVPVLLPFLPELQKILPDVEFPEDAGGVCMWKRVEGFILVLVIIHEDHYTTRTITHEMIHAKNMTFNLVGQELDLDNDEFEAYFMGRMTHNMLNTWEEQMKAWRKETKEQKKKLAKVLN